MKSPKASKPSSRVRNRTRSVKISSTAHGLTSQAGLIPVVKYLDRIGFEKTVKRSVAHPRGDNADYHLSDAVLLTLVGMIGGATSMAKVTTVWADSVLRKVAGWVKVPVETTILRIFKELSDAQISQFEALTHTLRGQHWRRLLRSGKSKTAYTPSNGFMLIQLLIRFVVDKKEVPKVSIQKRKVPVRTIHKSPFWRKQKKFYKPGSEQAMPLRVMVWLNLPNNYWPTYPTGCALFFEVTVVILWATYLNCLIPEGMAI